jgi:hypothetical protein
MCSRRYTWGEVYERVKNRLMRAFHIVKTHLTLPFHLPQLAADRELAAAF